jgi:hypothetical protein
MKQRKLTPEQEAERAERKARQKELAREISAMSFSDRVRLCPGGIKTIEGRTLSPFNSAFVLKQNSEATVVGGFHQWRAVGRMVRKGQHGLAIWVPIGNRNDDGEVTERTGFVGGTVFDISQTDEIPAETLL